MKKHYIVLIGGGGHCKSCIDVIEKHGGFDIVGIVDVKSKVGKNVLGYPIIASDDELPDLIKKYKNVLVTIGQTKDASARYKKFIELKNLGANLPVIISPRASISKTARIDEGTIVMHDALVNVDSVIGKNCIINTKALIEHEVIVGDHTHVSTGTILNGQTKVGSKVFVGSGSVVVNNVTVADNVVIGAGAVVSEDIAEKGVYVGVPAKRLCK